MGKKVQYYYPNDQDQLLLEEDHRREETRVLKMLVPERPLMCPKCNKSYYKWECVKKEV